MRNFREKAYFDDVFAKKKTPKALICEIEDEEFVVPDSQIDEESEVIEEGDEGLLIVNQWWAEQVGLV